MTATSRTSCLTSNNGTCRSPPGFTLSQKARCSGAETCRFVWTGLRKSRTLTVASSADAVVHGQQQMIELPPQIVRLIPQRVQLGDDLSGQRPQFRIRLLRAPQ